LYKIRLKILSIANKLLISFFVKNEMFQLLGLLFLLNLTKIRKILPKKKIKYRAIVLYRTGGIDDLIQSQKRYNKNILYLACPREFFKYIFLSIFEKKNRDFTDFQYTKGNKQINDFKKKYRKFLISFLKVLKKRYNFNIIISFNFLYSAERELQAASNQLKIPFLILFKESIHTKIQKKYFLYTYKQINEKFNGYKIAVYSKYAKKLLVDSNIINKQDVEVVGCSRLNKSFSYKKINPKNQITYYAIQNYRGLPTILLKSFGKEFYKNMKDSRLFNPKYNWKKLHIKIIKILKNFALQNPKIPIVIKIKNGEQPNNSEYRKLPNNIKIIDYGAGHTLLKDSKIVIGWNTTSILEAVAANRRVLIPYFYKKDFFFKNAELKLGLKKECYANSENDFLKRLNFLIKKNYNKNIVYNNLNSLNYHLGNVDNKAGRRLDQFLKNNLNYKNR
jgi:hypothetical protein